MNGVAGGAPRRRSAAALALILIGGSLLILPRLGSQSLWGDEGLTVLAVTGAASPHDVIERARVLDTQPPAAHLLLYATRRLLPDDEFGWRLPSFLLCEAAIALIAILAGRLWGSTVAVWAAAAAQVSPFLAFYAMEARGYGLWLLACCAAALGMARCVEKPGIRRAVPWGLANALGLWTNPFHLFAMVMQMVILAALVRSRPAPDGSGRRLAAAGVVAQAIAVALFLPWLVMLVSTGALARSVGWTRSPAVASLLYYPFALVFGFSWGPSLDELHADPLGLILARHPVASVAAAGSLLVLGGAALLLARDARGDRRRRGLAIAVAAALCAGLLGPAFYVVLAGFPLLPRHLIYVWPAVPILEALALVRRPRLRPLIFAVLALQGIALLNLLYDPAYAKDDERAAIQFAVGRSGDRPVVLGDVAPIYAPVGRGLLRNRTDPGDATRFAGATDVWLVDSRAWEDPDGRYRARLERSLTGMGLAYVGEEGTFHGLVLRHWRRESDS